MYNERKTEQVGYMKFDLGGVKDGFFFGKERNGSTILKCILHI